MSSRSRAAASPRTSARPLSGARSARRGFGSTARKSTNGFASCSPTPFQGGAFYLFPKQNQQPEAERWRFGALSLIWQIRHTVVHNVGVITQSDAVKLRVWAKEPVASPRVLSPSREDIRYLKRFLDETATSCNQRIGERLATLLTDLHTGDPSLFVPQVKADELSLRFGFALTVAGATGVLPPP